MVGACDEGERLRFAVSFVADVLSFKVVIVLGNRNLLDGHSLRFVVVRIWLALWLGAAGGRVGREKAWEKPCHAAAQSWHT